MTSSGILKEKDVSIDFRKKIFRFSTLYKFAIDTQHRFEKVDNDDLKQTNTLQLAEVKADKGPLVVFKTLLKIVRIIHDRFPNDFFSYLTFGVVKTSKNHGMTSVAQGVAELIFNDCNHENEPNVVIFAGFGTGGVKMQAFWRREQIDHNSNCKCIISSLCEVKGDGGSNETASINAIQLGHWMPKTMGSMSAEDRAKVTKAHMFLMNEACKQILEKCAAAKYTNIRKVYVFITGPARQAWETAQNTTLKMEMEDGVTQFLLESTATTGICFVAWNGKSWFMSQKEEAEMEMKACTALYSNLYVGGILPHEYHIVASWGVGRGSAQAFPIMVNLGMDAAEEFEDVITEELMQQIANGTIQTFLDDIDDVYMLYQKIPMIALKSGFALVFEDKRNEWILDALCEIEDADDDDALCEIQNNDDADALREMEDNVLSERHVDLTACYSNNMEKDKSDLATDKEMLHANLLRVAQDYDSLNDMKHLTPEQNAEVFDQTKNAKLLFSRNTLHLHDNNINNDDVSSSSVPQVVVCMHTPKQPITMIIPNSNKNDDGQRRAESIKAVFCGPFANNLVSLLGDSRVTKDLCDYIEDCISNFSIGCPFKEVDWTTGPCTNSDCYLCSHI